MQGQVYIIYGHGSPIGGRELLLSTLNGFNGFIVDGIEASSNFGYSLGYIGDINNDGYYDILIGSPDSSNSKDNIDSVGYVYLIYGFDLTSYSTPIDINSLINNDGNNEGGMIFEGYQYYEQVGYSFNHFMKSNKNGFDYNGDGIYDLIIGAYGSTDNSESESQTGRTYVITDIDYVEDKSNSPILNKSVYFIISLCAAIFVFFVLAYHCLCQKKVKENESNDDWNDRNHKQASNDDNVLVIDATEIPNNLNQSLLNQQNEHDINPYMMLNNQENQEQQFEQHGGSEGNRGAAMSSGHMPINRDDFIDTIE